MELRKVHIYFELFSLEWQEHLMDAVEKTAHLTLSEGCKSIPWFPVQLLTVTFEQTANGRYVDVLLPESMFNLVTICTRMTPYGERVH